MEWKASGDERQPVLLPSCWDRGRKLGQGKTTLNPHCQPRGAISANQNPSAKATTTSASSLDHLSSFGEIIRAILSALHGSSYWFCLRVSGARSRYKRPGYRGHYRDVTSSGSAPSASRLTLIAFRNCRNRKKRD